MRPRILAAVTAAAGVLIVAPTATGAQAADAGSPGGIDTDVQSVKKMAAEHLAQQYGLDKETATHRVEAQGEFSKKAKKATDELGGENAGSYIDQKRGVLVVQTTKDEAKNKVKDKITTKDTEIKVVSRSMNTLEDQAKKLTDKLGDKLITARVDVAHNRVVVEVKKDQVAFAQDAAKGMDGVQVEGTETQFTPQAELYGGQQIQVGSGGGMCSIGFMGAKDGKDVLITAGHCAVGNAAFFREGKEIARTAAYAFPGNDMAYAPLAQGWTGQPGVDKWNGRGVAVKGSEEAPVGAAICKSGRTTKWTCGVIQAKNVTNNYGGSGRMGYGLTQTDACTEPGDSGGAWIAGDQAQGVHSAGGSVPVKAGSPTCGKNNQRGNRALFQPINPLLQKYGLQLKTYQG
ncbi:hypothetical protein KEM60_02160 [Austwickia sp. TVS 96-490-7B]|uniref:peptidase n=1 Tax=Austwickia sp. TVS 96-490-7B TaxID=2830843 RepID=UPI001C581AEC|nr:peptidase [Austwickia sp. TVS 96-490-7B]MBW3085949.1 hypothetical protein [Austwickia sp. TVS 96-490-7B]